VNYEFREDIKRHLIASDEDLNNRELFPERTVFISNLYVALGGQTSISIATFNRKDDPDPNASLSPLEVRKRRKGGSARLMSPNAGNLKVDDSVDVNFVIDGDLKEGSEWPDLFLSRRYDDDGLVYYEVLHYQSQRKFIFTPDRKDPETGRWKFVLTKKEIDKGGDEASPFARELREHLNVEKEGDVHDPNEFPQKEWKFAVLSSLRREPTHEPVSMWEERPADVWAPVNTIVPVFDQPLGTTDAGAEFDTYLWDLKDVFLYPA